KFGNFRWRRGFATPNALDPAIAIDQRSRQSMWNSATFILPINGERAGGNIRESQLHHSSSATIFCCRIQRARVQSHPDSARRTTREPRTVLSLRPTPEQTPATKPRAKSDGGTFQRSGSALPETKV